ncbi:hypothetical protein SNE40_018374 [Patella caerulea]|uniref:Uncharacterized protein n=1 Tax=Patella caerulea TaxID=87958 RepID=A0AAN8PH45_PATCE
MAELRAETIVWTFVLAIVLKAETVYVGATLMNGGTEAVDFFSLNKRTTSEPFAPGAPLPWSCRRDSHWKLLGENHYPSRLFEVQCLSDTCWYGHYNCTSVYGSVQVLKLCLATRCSDHRVPVSLRRNWQFVDVDVSVGCQCMR